jgi:hypothetical protein
MAGCAPMRVSTSQADSATPKPTTTESKPIMGSADVYPLSRSASAASIRGNADVVQPELRGHHATFGDRRKRSAISANGGRHGLRGACSMWRRSSNR